MSSDVPYLIGFLAAASSSVDVGVVAAVLGVIWVGIQILDRLSPKATPELKALIEVTAKLTEEVRTLTGTVNAAVKLSDERFDRVLDQLRESRGRD